MTSLVASARHPLPHREGRSVFARIVAALEAARERARVRAEMRRVLRLDARLRRDLGLSRFDVAVLTDQD
jgi:uncharacterized protein YjiS (DUF1127 family)